MKLVFAAYIICSLLLSSSFLEATSDPRVDLITFCDGKCKARCAKAGVRDRCLKYCGLCCRACKCVPSGTYGNKHQCPCYRDMKNSKGKAKCP